MPRYSVLLSVLMLLALFGFPGAAQAQEQPQSPQITSPAAGQALQGNVTITGSAAVEGFASAELTFAYSNDPTGTWFFIEQFDSAVIDGVLANWDTTLLTDGDYILRLTIFLQDGSTVMTEVAGLRIRNYTAIETETPTPVLPTQTPLPGATDIPTITPTPTGTLIPPTLTPLAPNPAVMTEPDITLNMVRGVLIAVAAFAAVALVFAIAKLRRR